MGKFTIILVGGEYDVYDFVLAQNNVKKTLEEWEEQLKKCGYWYKVRQFDSKERMNAYISAIGDAEDYLSGDFYTFGIIRSENIIAKDIKKKKFRVWRFVLGCDPELTKDWVEVEAETQDEAEEMVSDPYKGWGVVTSEEVTDEEE